VPEVAFVLAEGSRMRELAEVVGHELALQDVAWTVHSGEFPPAALQRVHVLVDPVGFVAAHGQAALPVEGVLRRSIFICARLEPRPSAATVSLLRRAGAVFTLDPRDAVELAHAGVQARQLRPGYSEALDRGRRDEAREIEVGFLGPLNHRQSECARLTMEVLGDRHCVVIGAGGAGGRDLQERLEALARCRVAIALRRDDADPRLEAERVVEAIHAGAAVVCEHGVGVSPLVAGEHLLAGSAPALGFLARVLLREPARREALRDAARARLRDWLPLALHVAVLRAAVVELVGEPWPAGMDPISAVRADGRAG